MVVWRTTIGSSMARAWSTRASLTEKMMYDHPLFSFHLLSLFFSLP
jgi:hypothetical protein